jgi:soluble lytic murein transglycosylase-like protein
MYLGKLDQAQRLANESHARSGFKVPMAGWVKGLTEWQKGDYQGSAAGFQSSASSPYASGWLISASAYWASRAHMRSGNPELVSKWLSLASTYPRTFYGLIAIRALGYQSAFNWSLPNLNREYRKIIENTDQGKRASALIQAGQYSLAEAELKNLSFNDDVTKKRALLAYAHHYNLPSLMMALGNSFSGPKGQFYDAALYPLAAWEPENGYKIDKALLHAFVRQESRFNQRVSNPSGATGLMQLMPSTANHVSGQEIYQTKAGQYRLLNPKVNLDLGQKYIQELLNYNQVNNDLISLAVAYNAGPGTLSKWKAERLHIDDPLLFIETIPYPETRAFVERVLANYWIYKIRFEEPTPSLDAVAEGKWATRVASKN